MLPTIRRLLPLALAALLSHAGSSIFASANSVLARMDSTTAVGTNPIVDPKAEYLGLQKADNSCSHRDLGFTGAIAGKWYAVWGDVLWCDAGVTDPERDTPGFHGMVRDAVSATTGDPLLVHDLNLGDNQRQRQFIPFNASWGEKFETGFGGTSLVETDAAAGTGAVFYLVVSLAHLPRSSSVHVVSGLANGPKNQNAAGLVGAGIARVDVIDGTPTVTRRHGERGYWWPADSNPQYGDIAAFRDPRSDYIYAWGGPPTTVASSDWVQSSYVYMVRVKAHEAFDLSRYEYWWGRQRGWRTERLTVFTAETAALWGIGQGQVVWNEFYSCYIFVHLGIGGGTVFLRTAPAPEGPWTPDVKIFEAAPIDGGLVYAGVAHPYLDETGRTLVISFTNNNRIQVIKATFSP
ncbi:secreted protein [Colletotrichum higginsianum IMI 349063]|uniref:Secreted protein n=1 Tax=Colletotrichum higginsianum (strain IMI 349063) TaxID=759273 RepID=A0A1B7Y4J4_COLHI|nr:secreted protein [Colletotrichum higginsianum IMI 349063]OBR06947.1 secreted protein [Colletotrichum higginsianum IMI 349063]